MEPEEVVLGLDTSCYTTSVALMDLRGNLVADERQVLEVRPGRKGLAQSEMVFQHTRNLPVLIERLQLAGLSVKAIGVSARPRPLTDSYMPAFLAGRGMARSLAHLLQVPFYETTHQHNHMFAGLWSAGQPVPERCLLVHISGGTTDLVLAEAEQAGSPQVKLTPLGTSIDLHAGQFIDRVGVAMGLAFPCGAALEKKGQEAATPYELPVWSKDGNLSLSGPCTKALRALEAGADPAAIALGVEQVIAKGLSKTIYHWCKETQVQRVLLAGGVSANGEIRRILKDYLNRRQVSLWAPEPRYSVDGAVGTAWYTVLCHRQVTA